MIIDTSRGFNINYNELDYDEYRPEARDDDDGWIVFENENISEKG